MSKASIRNYIISIRKTLNKCTKSTSEKIVLQKLNHVVSKTNSKVGVYLSTTHEFSTRDIISNLLLQNHEIYFPVINPYHKRSMFFQKRLSNTKYCANKYNIKEPIFNPIDVVSPWELDYVIVPIIAFNLNLKRLGMGGGYYDYTFRYIKGISNPKLIGIAFDFQYRNEIPVDSWDLQLDYIITPSKLYEKYANT